jgi:predicted GIY-YIG superfamily endonuclease
MKEEREYYTYILANEHGMFYVGVTGDLFQRVLQHCAGIGSVYTKKY